MDLRSLLIFQAVFPQAWLALSPGQVSSLIAASTIETWHSSNGILSQCWRSFSGPPPKPITHSDGAGLSAWYDFLELLTSAPFSRCRWRLGRRREVSHWLGDVFQVSYCLKAVLAASQQSWWIGILTGYSLTPMLINDIHNNDLFLWTPVWCSKGQPSCLEDGLLHRLPSLAHHIPKVFGFTSCESFKGPLEGNLNSKF